MGKDSSFPGDRTQALGAVKEMLRYLGENEKREGLRLTPERVLNSWNTLFGGYLQDPSGLFYLFLKRRSLSPQTRSSF